jgi:hypothetical protein
MIPRDLYINRRIMIGETSVVINPQLFLRVFYAENKALNSFYQMAKYS